MFDRTAARWVNEPPHHEWRNETLVMRTGRDTDWWNTTFYGFRHLSGHMLGAPADGDFTLELTVAAPYERQYDQAGAMVYVDENHWMKCGVEYTEDSRKFSAVVTNGDQSDWAVRPLGGEVASPVEIRVTRHAEALRIDLREGGHWTLVRLCFLRMSERVQVGPLACSPSGEGLEVSFPRIALGPAI